MVTRGMEASSALREGCGEIRGRTAVLGLGNPVCSDDGAGLAVAAELARLLAQAPIPAVDVLTSTRGGFELLDLLQGYARAIIVDCLDVPNPHPGRIRQLTLRDVSGSPRLINAHEITIGVAFQLAERLGLRMPDQVQILGIEGRDLHTLGEELTPAVRAAVQSLARRIHACLVDPPPVPDPPEA